MAKPDLANPVTPMADVHRAGAAGGGAGGLRVFSSYLPPIWGWATLIWMRKREYL